ncbi:putative bifunctional diguanylate cyclase/phosphodiesterase [Trichlorobacter lovleyi]|uniref:Diguanylate cyclase/phosphodiesterase with PAS/PAC sensor(S) n=2 Tax=Trichlorobacter lovleyi TaxID=313985 RepID=B3E9P2_TRIL1|nr:bifunctional diguanylate cyclase/phosphodiesterase [Trichlorobacter lovleyi]ACD95318.1 diguanylate cyclase/phosphodiesterase with PAS/PAC sensor(s) [Trichlorobacter lovleyi SZ]
MTPVPSQEQSSQPSSAWFDSLSRLIQPDARNRSIGERLVEQCVRVSLMVKLRWAMLAALFCYVLLAELFLAPDIDLPIFHIEQWSLSLKATAIFFAVAFPLVSLPCSVWRNCRLVIYLQVLLDLLFVTAAIHWSGGVVSWLWPAYLLISLESAFLFEKKREVWGIGMIGAALYGVLLAAEQLDFIATVRMPFMEEESPSILFELLMWLWVAGVNTVVSFFGAFLMDKIRSDHQKVQQSQEALTGFIATAHDLIFCCRQDGTLLYLNQVGQDMIGPLEGEGGDISLFNLTDEEGKGLLARQFEKVTRRIDAGHFEMRLLSPAVGRILDLEVSLSTCCNDVPDQVIWGVCHDITERNLAQRELIKLAHHDVLTGLPNRILLHDRLQQARAFAHRMNSRFALLFLDMDRFKIINDTLGHAVGDDLLRMIAQRLKACFRETDTVARIGGDEFVVLMLNVTDRTDICTLNDKLLQELAQPFMIRGHELFVTTSGGVCTYPDDEDDVEIMMQKADIAMYHAKALGRNNIQFYNDGMDQNSSRRFTIANSMRRGLDRGEFRLYYQPKLDVSSDCIVATEALVRWQHPELGLLAPTEFIQLAEESGLIVELGEWVLREACRQNMVWRQEGMRGLRVAVNLSGYQLQHSRLVETVRKVLDETGMPGELLEFEITESVIMQNPDYAVEVLNEITNLGIHISIDDFGTGYSSLAHLKRFSVNTLKIDKSFVRDVENNTTDAAIASAIIAMGSSLNLKVIAEGVETEQQMDFLRDNNCDQVQGFLISRPLPADQALKVLRQKCIGELAQGREALKER